MQRGKNLINEKSKNKQRRWLINYKFLHDFQINKFIKYSNWDLIEMQAQSSDDILGPKKMNYEFLLLVRDKKYQQALILGKKILSTNPDNPSVLKFCSFIEKNNKQIMKMVEKQKEEEEYESVDSDDEQGEQQEEAQGDEKSDEDSKESQDDEKQEQDQMEEQQEIEPKEKKQKIQLTTCTLNQIPHICPRHHKQKQQTQSTQASKEKQNSN